MSCHAEIRRRLANRLGYHARAVNLSKQAQDCVRCHTEHYGENFNIVRWQTSRDEFDHRETGYLLQGKHTGLACERCHTPAHIAPEERRTIMVRDLSRTFLGLSPQCLTCHQDEHRGQLGTDCSRCHFFKSWKSAAGFDHDSARFHLTGLHEKLACQKCHPRMEDGKPHTQYTGLSFASCSACHKDPHRGAFELGCQNCHTTSGWHRVQVSSGFDHSRTRFALSGKHAGVSCLKCHRGSNFKEPVAHTKCMDCHQDVHRGQFRNRSDGGDCRACHNESGFEPSLFTASHHQQTRYPLTGKHVSVTCAKCHKPAGADTLYRVRHSACLDCHKDYHAGQFASPPHSNHCEACHTVDGFRPSKFTMTRHSQTRFPLLDAHRAVACVECHRPPLDVQPPVPAPFKFENISCVTCHQDPHRDQVNAAACTRCHTARSWKEISGFDHSTTGFSLLGAHRAVACTACHGAASLGNAVREVLFRGAPSACAGCHEDAHGGQFASAGRAPNCAGCHTVAKWKPSSFDHEKGSTFSLAGAHQNAACGACHRNKRETESRIVLIYKGTPRECASCH